MTYMSGLSGEVAIDCFPYEGNGGDLSFEDGELVFFLGQQEVQTALPASLIGFNDYYFMKDNPFPIVSRFNKEENILYVVSGAGRNVVINGVPVGNGPVTIINRCFIMGDIVVGNRSGAVRRVGKEFKMFDGKLRCSISEIGYDRHRHDLLNFNEQGIYDRENPLNLNFYKDTFFNNLDYKFSCIPLCDRLPLPVPYTANRFGFKLCCAVTRRHIIIAEHVRPHMTNDGEFKFYDPESDSVISRRVLFYKGIGTIFSELSYSSSLGPDISIGVLDEDLPESILLACLPYYPEPGLIPKFSSVNGIFISSDMRGYSVNYMNNNIETNSIFLGNMNQEKLISNTIDAGSCFLSGGVGDSNSLHFLKNNNDLIFCGCVSNFGNASLGGLLGEFSELNRPYGSNFIIDFEYYPDYSGDIVNSPVNRYRFLSYNSELRFWLSLDNDICNEIFSSKLVWGSSTNSSIIPNRKTLSEFEIIDTSHSRLVNLDNYNKNKIKYI